MVSRWLDAPAVESPVARRIPWAWVRRKYTALRTIWGHLCWAARPTPLPSSALWGHMACLSNSGFTTIPAFLTTDQFAAVWQEYQAVRSGAVTHTRQRITVKAGLRTHSVIIAPMDLAFPRTNSIIRNQPTIKALVEYASHHTNIECPETFSIMEHTVDSLPVEDNTAALHQDVGYPSIKVVLYLTDVQAHDGPFLYVPTSHKLTRERLTMEQDILERRYTQTGGTFYGMTPVLDPQWLQQRGYRVQAITAPKNTLIIADHFGLHAHGPMRVDCARVTLRISFRFLDSRRYRWRRVLNILRRWR